MLETESTKRELLILHITTVVPFMILDLIRDGGITDQRIEEARRYVDIIGSEGDAILYRTKTKGQTSRAIDALCRGLATLALQPGGVIFMGVHLTEESGLALIDLFARLRATDFNALNEAMDLEDARVNLVQTLRVIVDKETDGS